MLCAGAGVLVLALAGIIAFTKPVPFVVDAGQFAIVTDFGKPTQVITSPGLRFRRLYESVRTFDKSSSPSHRSSVSSASGSIDAT